MPARRMGVFQGVREALDPVLLQVEVAGDGCCVEVEPARDAAAAGQGGLLRRRVRHLHLAETGVGHGAVANFRPAILAPDISLPVIVALSMEVRGTAGASKVPPTIGGESRFASRSEILDNSPPVVLGREIADASKTPPRTGPSSRTISPISVMERPPKSMSQQAARSHPEFRRKRHGRRARPERRGRLSHLRRGRDGGHAWNDRRQGARRKRRIMPALGSGRVRRSTDPACRVG